MLWGATLALGIAGWDWAEARFRQAARRETIILLPARELDDPARDAAAALWRRESAVASARWLTPAEVESELRSSLSSPPWSEKLGADAATLPALLELTPARPLEATRQLIALTNQAAQSGQWLPLWNHARVLSLRADRQALRWVLGGWLSLVLACGGLALARLPRGDFSLLVASGLLGALAPAAVVLGAAQAGLPGVGAQNALLAGATGLLLAGGLAGMLRLPGPAMHPPDDLAPEDVLEPPPPPRRPMRLSVKESPDERHW